MTRFIMTVLGLIVVLLLVPTQPKVEAQGTQTVVINFDDVPDDTPASALSVPGATLSGAEWTVRTLGVTDSTLLSGKVLVTSRATNPPATFTLTFDFDTPQTYYEWTYGIVGEYTVNVVGFRNGSQVFDRIYNPAIIPELGGPFRGGRITGFGDFDRLVYNATTDTDTVIDFFTTVIPVDAVGGACVFTDNRLNNDPSRDCAPAHVDYCENNNLVVRNVDGFELIILPLTIFATPPATGEETIIEQRGIIITQNSTGTVFITGFEADPFWPGGAKPYVVQMNPDCSGARNVSPLVPN